MKLNGKSRFNQPNNLGFYSAGAIGTVGCNILVLKDLQIIIKKNMFFDLFFWQL
jgi:hypothetical protein